jgi:hypothetical protein
VNPELARRMWWATEPYHAVVYFAPETRDACTAIGLKGFWMGYFAGRAAPMGPVPPAVVQATFFNFAPAMVARAIPDAWALAAPEVIVNVRLDALDDALRRLLGDIDVAEAAALARDATAGCDAAGRPLFAAHAAMEWPDEPRLALWHACTLLREFRGDGHVAALLTEGFDGCEAHVTVALSGAVPAEMLRSNRGWSEDEWAAARARVEARDWRAARARVEARTDELALAPWRALGDEGCDRLLACMRPIVARLVEQEAVAFPNPMGLPAPRLEAPPASLA